MMLRDAEDIGLQWSVAVQIPVVCYIPCVHKRKILLKVEGVVTGVAEW